jgi:hypothetical protein
VSSAVSEASPRTGTDDGLENDSGCPRPGVSAQSEQPQRSESVCLPSRKRGRRPDVPPWMELWNVSLTRQLVRSIFVMRSYGCTQVNGMHEQKDDRIGCLPQFLRL